ncbi:MAG: cytochrome P450 [Xanthobacteraceae bacterium]|nr:cytochrome P450 [Xanthobacteraceae bacterium]
MTTQNTRPTLEGFDPFAPDHLRDPYPMFARARAEAPVFYYEPLNFWMVTRYEDVAQVVRDFETFSSNVWRVVPRPADFADQLPENLMANSFINLDPPAHTVSRKNAQKAFTRGLVAALEPRIGEICHELIDGFISAGQCDLMPDFCYPMSLRVIVHMLGLPEEDMPKFRQWTEDVFSLMSPAARGDDSTSKPMPREEVLERYGRLAHAYEYYSAIVEARRREPTDDLTSAMARARADDGTAAIAQDRIVMHMLELTAAGNDTTANNIANMIRFFDDNPDQLARALEDPALMDNAIEEGLRLRAASPTMFRLTTRDVALSGVTVPANSVVCVNFGAANHDEEHFGDPSKFNIDRKNADEHFTFGKGRHFCLGAPLARLETKVALNSLYGRLGPIHVLPDQDEVYLPVITLDSRLHMRVVWRAEPA